MNRAGIYSRVITRGQGECYCLDVQTAESVRAAEADSYTLFPEHAVAEQFSGSVLERAGLSRIRSLAARGEVQAASGMSLDRFTRNPVDALFLLQEFEELGVTLVFVEARKETHI